MTSNAMPHIIGNWKMALNDIETAVQVARDCADMANDVLERVEVGVATPFLWIPALATETYESNLLMGAQDVSAHEQGAYTGEVSAEMLAPWCAFALVGHSERRQYHGETDDLVRAKVDHLYRRHVAPLLCVGETQAERDAGDALAVVERQVRAAAGHLSPSQLQTLIVAYEPVWAIGTGNTATPADAQAMAARIRGLLEEIDAGAAAEVPILYGGSVKAGNAGSFFGEPDIDGALVGGASIDTDQFVEIIRAALGS